MRGDRWGYCGLLLKLLISLIFRRKIWLKISFVIVVKLRCFVWWLTIRYINDQISISLKMYFLLINWKRPWVVIWLLSAEHDTKSLEVKDVSAVSPGFKLWINNRCNLFDCTMINNSTIITIILRKNILGNLDWRRTLTLIWIQSSKHLFMYIKQTNAILLAQI